MEHQLIFYPVGNGDCNLIKLSSGKKIIIDFYHPKGCEGDDTNEINLIQALRDDLENVKEIDVLVITHADNDHVGGLEDFFELPHADKYIGKIEKEGKKYDRIKIKELWVPAYAVIGEQPSGSASVLKNEALDRIKKGTGIRVFSATQKFKDWLSKNDINGDGFIIYPGTFVNGTIDEAEDQVKIFCHAPFVKNGEEEDRNKASIVLHFTFSDTGIRFLTMGDQTYEVISDIVFNTINHNNMDKFEWDILKIPHHCSYCSIASEKGKDETEPENNNVRAWLNAGQQNCIIISSSRCCPPSVDENAQPPHAQAMACYKKYAKEKNGTFIITMEHPDKNGPERLQITINENGHKLNDVGNNKDKTPKKPLVIKNGPNIFA